VNFSIINPVKGPQALRLRSGLAGRA